MVPVYGHSTEPNENREQSAPGSLLSAAPVTEAARRQRHLGDGRRQRGLRLLERQPEEETERGPPRTGRVGDTLIWVIPAPYLPKGPILPFQ